MMPVKSVLNTVNVCGFVNVNITSVYGVMNYTVNAHCVKLKHVDIVKWPSCT